MPAKKTSPTKADRRKAKNQAKRGRKPSWDTRVQAALPKIEEMASKGAPDSEIIKHLKISQATFYKLKKEKKELLECLTRAREIACGDVDAAMHRAAVGFDYEEVHEEQWISINPSGGETRNQRRRVINRCQHPDTRAAALFLSRYDSNFIAPAKKLPSCEMSEEKESLFSLFNEVENVSGMRLPEEQSKAYQEKMVELGLVNRPKGDIKNE